MHLLLVQDNFTSNPRCTPGRAIIAALCSLAGRGQTLKAASQGTDGLVIEAVLPSDMFAFEGTQSDTLKRYRDLGVARVVLVAPRRLADALPFLDRMARVIPAIA